MMVGIDLSFVLAVASILRETTTAPQGIPIAPTVTSAEGTDPTVDDARPVMPEVDENVIRKEGRIVGGEPTTIKNYPYLVQLSLRNNHVCGGSYIKTGWVLTAAHCIILSSERNPFQCSMAVTYLYEDDPDVQTRLAKKSITHPHYFSRNDTNDLGLIMLTKPFTLGMKVSIVKLARKPFSDYSVKCKVAGWGVTREEDLDDRSKLSDQLRHVYLPLVKQRECKDIFTPKGYGRHFVTNLVFCAGYTEGGYDACQGDSGGPFVCGKVQVGVVSWGIGCGREIPGVYVNIPSYIDWIELTIKKTKRKLTRRHTSKGTHSKLSFILLAILLIRVLIDA